MIYELIALVVVSAFSFWLGHVNGVLDEQQKWAKTQFPCGRHAAGSVCRECSPTRMLQQVHPEKYGSPRP